MDVSVARHQSNSNRADAARPTNASASSSGAPSQTPLASARRLSPLPYGILTGIAAAASIAFTACCMASVAGRLGPGRRYLNGAILLVSLGVGIYVGVRAWQKRKAPLPLFVGRCPDCGRESTAGEERCSLCGRPAQGV
ncbi:MAG TPA: hypothetical protein VG326_18290 [Tepidisphaeraceae bacterium]|nr:hypothetical protein [Tepidisphaeraceae bacterium]